MFAVTTARSHFGAKSGVLTHDGARDVVAVARVDGVTRAVGYSALYGGGLVATVPAPAAALRPHDPNAQSFKLPDAGASLNHDEHPAADDGAAHTSLALFQATAPSEPSAAVTGRADFGGTTPVTTGIGNTSSVGTTGNFVNQDINGLLAGSAWNTTALTYSFPTSADYYGSNYPDPAPFNGFQVLSLAQQGVVEYAFSLISAYTGLTFTEVTESNTTHATIRFADSSYPDTSYAYYPDASSTGGDVFFGNIRNDAPTKAGYAFDTIMHEIGHAVGLKHGQEDDGTHGVLPSAHDSTEWSIMDYHSYIGADGYYRNSEGSGNQTYMTDDISALQYLYGANYSTQSGNTTYTWNPNTGEEFINGVGQGASSTNTIYESIWDGNGTDTYDLSNYTTNVTVNLNPGEWSTFDTAELANLDSSSPGVYLAPGNIINSNEYNHDARSLIEDAFAGSGNDTLIGNAADNIFRGGGGNDTIVGGGGDDEAEYTGTQDQYVITVNADGTTTVRDTVANRDGTDTLSGIETISFAAAKIVADGEIYEVHGSSVAHDTQIASGGEQYVYGGGIAIDTLVSGGGLQLIGSGGTESATIVLAGGIDKVNSGGTSFQTIISSTAGVYGEQIVYTGGVAVSATVFGHQTLSGGVASASLVSGGGAVYVSSGGALRGARLLAGGSAYVGIGGAASATVVSSGGKLVANTGGVIGGTILRSGGTAYVNAQGSATGTILSSGGREVVSSGLDLSAVVSVGGQIVVSATGILSATAVLSGGTQIVSSGGVASATVVSSGGVQNVSSGGVEQASLVAVGGFSKVSAGGSSFGATISGAAGLYGEQIVYVGGVATSATVVGHQTLSGGVASATLLSAGGADYVSSGGALRGARLLSGGTAYVGSAGVASATVVSSGGKLVVNTGGFASGTILRSGGLAYVNALGSATGTILSSGGREVVSSGYDLSAVVSLGGQLVVSATGIVSRATILSGGTQLVSSGGIASGTFVSSGGVQYVSVGGIARATRISPSGVLKVFSGGQSQAAVVLSGSTLTVSSGGVASGTTISGGGKEIVSAGGIDRASVVSSGGMAFIASAGIVSGTTIVSGAKLTVSAGGLVRAGLTLSGGTAAISGTMATGQQVKFAGSGGVLGLYNLPAFAAVISGFSAGDRFDLGGFVYGASETRSFVEAASHTSGTLTVVAGAKTAHLTLLGSYATSNFTLATDNAGGTFVKFT